MLNPKFSLRQAQIEDLNFFYSTWLRALYYGNTWFKATNKDSFFAKYKFVVQMLLNRSTVSVVCLAEDPNVIIGYSVHEPNKLHWVYVKKSFRRYGVARSLIPEGIKVCTHLTSLGKKLKPKEWIFDPFLT